MFPGNPHDHSPCSSTPAGPSTRYGTKGQRTRHGPRTKAQRGLPTIANFGAQSHGFWSRCLRLEVEVTRHRARLASGCWSQLCRAGFDPQGFYERFLNWNSSSLPELHGASFVLALFYHHQLAPSGFTDDWPLSFRFTPHAALRWDQRGQVVRRPSPAGDCLPPTAQLPKTVRARSRRAGRLFQYVTEPDDFADKIICSSPLAAAHPLTVLSWPRRSTSVASGVPPRWP